MSLEGQAQERRVDELLSRVESLELRVDQLTVLVGGQLPKAAVTAPVTGSESPDVNYPFGEPEDVSEEVLTWAGRTAFLPRLATVCFLLVIALVLRTITDNGLVGKLVGSWMGMGYASILMVVGWYKYGKGSPLSPVFAACGALLMSAIVVETRMHFQSLPIVPAYLTLMATGVGMAFISRQYNAFTPISVGIIGMCFAGAALDYPDPYFPYLSLVMFTANILGYFAGRMKRCSWLRWTVLVVSMLMLQFWGFRIGVAFRRGEEMPYGLAPDWFLPVLAIFSIALLFLALLGILRDRNVKVSRFDQVLPTINLIWSFSAALNVLSAGGGNLMIFGTVGFLVAAGHIILSVWLAKRDASGASSGANSFLFACGPLLALVLPAATGEFILTLPIISFLGIAMWWISRIWQNGTVRLTSYVFQIYCFIALAFGLYGDSPGAMSAVNAFPAGLLSIVMVCQYSCCRHWQPPDRPSFFSRLDNDDRSAVLLLAGGLISGFYMLRILIFQAVQMLPVEKYMEVFRSSQSVLINFAAIGLVMFAYLRRNREIRNVAILITVAGAIKVFMFDLFGINGLPLVFSVFSFGLAAAVESLALGKWSGAGKRDSGAITDGISG